MYALRKFLYKPKKSDPSLLAQFYYADEDLCLIAAELDTLDGRKNPTKCAALVARLRQYQQHVLRLVQLIIDDTIPDGKAPRDFRVKYPDDLIQEGLAGQLWFGAECLAAGSSILNREVESESMRPLAKSLTKQIDQLRNLLRDQSLRDPLSYTDRIKQALRNFDATFAEFELSYVSAMVPVKTMKEYDMLQEVTVLFSETVDRAVSRSLITRDMVDYYDPALMFTIPRLAIVSGLVIFPEGPLNPTVKPCNISEMFRPFQTLLKRIRELLWTLSQDELRYLERLLCNMEEKSVVASIPVTVDKECKKTGKGRQSKAKDKGAASSSSSLFSEIADLVTSTSDSSSDQPSANDGMADGISSDDNSNHFDHTNTQPPTTAQESVIINDETTGEARLVHRPASSTYSESDRSPGSPTANNHNSSEPQVNRGQERSNYDAHIGASSEFSFHLPSGQPGRHVTINRSLSQDGGRADATPLIDLDQSSDSDSGTESSVSSDSETSSNSEELRHQQGQLMQSLLDTRTDGLRNRYRNTDELLQKLFICVSGVADQLQTNFASDLRNVLKQVFDMQSSELESPKINKSWDSNLTSVQSPPTWIPDSEMDKCGSCKMPFTFLRRRHHCRNCGLIFCSRCSSNSAPLPNYGYEEAVRICNKCYVYRVNPFYMDQDAASSSSSAANSQAPAAT